jgi:predicted DNA-binding transcriptional regulator AlpA
MDEERILGRRTVAARLGVSIATLDRMVSRKAFPAGFQITKQRVGWREATVNQWIISREASLNEVAA